MPNTLLVVDDSKVARLMIAAFAKSADPSLEIVEAESADAAIEAVAGKAIDLMTIDYNMPNRDGIDLAEELKDIYPNARIALLTANVQQTVRDRAAGLQIDFIAKPVQEPKVAAFIGSGAK